MCLDDCCVGCSVDPLPTISREEGDRRLNDVMSYLGKSIKRSESFIRKANFRKEHPYVYSVLDWIGVY